MSNVEIKNTMISFWSNALQSFYLANFGMTKEELLKMETMKEISERKIYNYGKGASETACISRAKKRVEEMTYNGVGSWESAVEYMEKSGFDSHFTIDKKSRQVKFTVNSFECSSMFDNAQDFLKRWKSYKVN